MAATLKELAGTVQYRDRRCPFHNDAAAYNKALATSTTVYVGNLAFTTREEQLYEVFGKVGPVDRVVMGLNQHTKQPCGFAFVMYYSHAAAAAAAAFVTGTKLDHRVIRVDVDWGFQEGRQYGRGKTGGQVRDEYRSDFDPGRGGENPMNRSYNEGMGFGPRRKRRRDEDGGPAPREEWGRENSRPAARAAGAEEGPTSPMEGGSEAVAVEAPDTPAAKRLKGAAGLVAGAEAEQLAVPPPAPPPQRSGDEVRVKDEEDEQEKEA